MKKILVLLSAVTIVLSCQTKPKNTAITITDKSAYAMYKSVVQRSIVNGWIVKRGAISKGIFVKLEMEKGTKVDGDRMWYQGYYGIYLALNYKTGDTNIVPIFTWIKAVNTMLGRTGGIWLRDTSLEAYYSYKQGKVELEASKDQINGLVSAMFMIHYFVNNKQVKIEIEKIANKLNLSLLKHTYTLYNEKEKRYYKSAYQVFQHYYGVSRALNFILIDRSITPKVMAETPIQTGFRKVICEIIKFKRRQMQNDIKVFDTNINEVKYLKDRGWYKFIVAEAQTKEEYAINLYFMELLVGGTLSRGSASDIMRMLEDDEVKKLKHLNLASLYIYLGRFWKMQGKSFWYYSTVLKQDKTWYPKNCPPNDYAYNGWRPDTENHNFHTNYQLFFSAGYGTTQKSVITFDSLIKASDKKIIKIDNGLLYMVRKLLTNI